MVVIKVYMGNDARRITVDDRISFADLRALLLNLFSVTGSGEPTSFKPTQLCIRYVDDEDDLVSIATDTDLHEAIAYSSGRADILRLRLYIEPAAEGTEKTAAGVNAIPHHTLQHRNNLVLQSLGQPEFAVQVSKMVKQVVSTQNTALTDLVQQMVLALAPQMETLLAPAVATVLQQHQAALAQQQQQQQQQLMQLQQQQQQQQYPPAYYYAAQQQASPLQAPNTYPAWPMQTPTPPAPGSMPSPMIIPPHASPSSTGPGVPAGLPEPLTPLPAAATPPAAEKKSTTPSGISAVRNILPSIFKVGIPTAAPGAADKAPPQQPQSQTPDGPTRTMSSSSSTSSSPPRSNDRRKRSTSSIHESDFSWVEPPEGGGGPPGSGGGGGGGGSGSGKWELPTARSRSSSNPVPIVPSRTSSTTDLSFMSPSTPSSLGAAASSTSLSSSLPSSSPFPSFSPSTPPSVIPSFPSSSTSSYSSTVASSSSSASSPHLMTSSSPPTRPRGPPALPPMSVNLSEEQYQQLYRDWAPVLKELAQMGFEDPRRNIDLLRTHKGSMVDVVEQLLSVPKT